MSICQRCVVLIVFMVLLQLLETTSAYSCSTWANNTRDDLSWQWKVFWVPAESVNLGELWKFSFLWTHNLWLSYARLKTSWPSFNAQVEYVSNVQNLHQCVKQSLVCPLMERSLNILLSNVLFSRIPHSQRQAELRIVVCVVFGGGLNRFIETDLVSSFLRFTRQFLSPQILLCRFFRLTKVQAWLISLCDRCVGDSSAIIIETQPPLSRIAASLSFMNVHGGEKQIIIVCMDLSVLFLWICSCIVLWICSCIVLWICLYIPPPPLPF